MARPRNKRPVSVAVTYSAYDDRWHGYKTLGTKPDGQPDIKHRSGKACPACRPAETPRPAPGCGCRESVEEKIRKLEDDLATGKKPAPRHDPKMADCLREWVNEGEAANRWKYNTVRYYRFVIEHYIIPNLGGVRRAALSESPAVVRRMRDELIRTDSAQAAKKAHEVLRAYLSDAVRDELVDRNVARLVKPPVVEEKDVDPLTRDELKVVMPVLERHRLNARWLVAITMGQRQGECLGLMWRRPESPRIDGDIDLVAGTMTIREKLLRKTWRHGCADPHVCGAASRPKRPKGLHRTDAVCPGRGPTHDRYHRRGCPKSVKPCPPGCAAHARSCPQRVGGGLVREKPKSRAGERTAAIPKPVLVALRDWKVQQDAEREAAGDLWQDTGHVFTTEFGRPIDPRRDWQQLQDILTEAGLPRARVHALRHSAATLMLLKGINKRVVMEILGWSQESMLGRYQKVVDELKRDAANKVADALWGKDKKAKRKKAGKKRQGGSKDTAERHSSTDQATGLSAEIIPLRRKAV